MPCHSRCWGRGSSGQRGTNSRGGQEQLGTERSGCNFWMDESLNQKVDGCNKVTACPALPYPPVLGCCQDVTAQFQQPDPAQQDLITHPLRKQVPCQTPGQEQGNSSVLSPAFLFASWGAPGMQASREPAAAAPGSAGGGSARCPQRAVSWAQRLHGLALRADC